MEPIGGYTLKNHINTIKLTSLGGLNNLNYLISYDDKNYFLKYNLKKRNYFNEYNLIDTLNTYNICPKVIYKDPSSYTILSDYLPNSNIDETTCQDLNFLYKLAKKLKEMHSLSHIYFYNPFDEIRKNISLLEEKTFQFPKNFSLLLKKLKVLEADLITDIDIGLCHNDLNPSNILYYKDNVYFIDFEYSGMCDIFFDLATFCWLLNFNCRKRFLEFYFGQCTKKHLNKLENYIFVVKFWNATWSYVQSFNSNIEYDYKTGGDMVLEALSNELNKAH